MDYLLGEGLDLAGKDTLYRCLDRLLVHKRALFDHLTSRWRDLFGVRFEVLLYDLTSTYFEIDPPQGEEDKRRYGYSRDKRSDCVQVVIALIVTPESLVPDHRRSLARLARYTQPENEHKRLLAALDLELPAQAPRRITT